MSVSQRIVAATCSATSGGTGPSSRTVTPSRIDSTEFAALDESCDVTDLDEQPGRTGWTDAIEIGQPRASGDQQAVEFLVRGVLASVDYIGAGVFGR